MTKSAWHLFAIAAACQISTGASAGDERGNTLLGWHDGAADFKIESTTGTASGVGGSAFFSLDSEILPLSAEGSVHAGEDPAHTSMWQSEETRLAVDVPSLAPFDVKLTAADQTESRYSEPTAGEMHQQNSETLSGKVEVVAKAAANASISMGAELSDQAARDAATGSSTAQERKGGAASADVFANAEWKIGRSVAVRVGAEEQRLSARRGGADAVAQHAYFAPAASLSVTPWRGTEWTLSLERPIAPYEHALIAALPLLAGTPTLPLEPDHAWHAEARLKQRLGAALLEARLDEDRAGTRWEIGGTPSVPAPTSASLLAQHSADVSVVLPLDQAGIRRTRMTVKANWQSSRVVDPVTHQIHAVSAQAPYTAGAELSHGLVCDQIEIGIRGEARGAVTSYAPADVVMTSPGANVGAFLRFKPGPIEFDLDAATSVGPGRQIDLHFRDGRGTSSLAQVASRAVNGPSLTLALKKSL